jgi:hypothetical protein
MIDEEEDTEPLATAEQSNVLKNENKSKKNRKKAHSTENGLKWSNTNHF